MGTWDHCRRSSCGNAAYQELATELQDEAASIFLLHENAVWGIQADVEDFEPHPSTCTSSPAAWPSVATDEET